MISATAPTLSIDDNDQEIWFRYYAEDQTGDAHVHIRYDNSTERLSLLLEGNQNRLRINKRVSGTFTTIVQRDDYPTELNTWYNVYIRAAGPYIEVRRGKEGEPLEFVFQAFDAPMFDSESFSFATEAGGLYRFDDLRIKFHNNLGDFLHLKSDSDAIDRAAPDISTLKRDFDDHFGFSDIPDIPDDLNHDPLRVYDMGADEYPTQGGFTYWWRNF